MPNIGFREIASRLRDQIESGELAAGAPLPSESTLASQYGVSRTTARRALVALEEGGLAQGANGRVRFVRSAAGSQRPVLARFEQVAAAIRKEIENGRARPGQQIGTEAALAERFGVSPGTVRRGLQDLAGDGLVAAVSGQGWFVSSPETQPTRTAETAAAIRALVVSGEWPVGTQIPGELALAKKYGVGRVTVRRALALLESDGLLSKRAGRGREVCRREIG